MQSKAAIRFFAIALALVCLYQLSFTLITRNVEKKAAEYANGDPKKEKAYLDSVSSKGVYNILVKDYTYQECKEREINLGLDLKGGMNVTMEVSVVDLIRSMANYSTDPTFNKALSNAAEMQKNSQKDFVTLFGEEYQKLDANARLASVFSTKDLHEKVSFNSTNQEVLKVIRTEADGAIDRSFNILRTRIDKFGVSQPSIQKIGSGRILIELPGVKDRDRVRKLLQGTAKLEFWETYDNANAFKYLVEINKMLKDRKDTLKGGDTSKIVNAAAAKDSSASEKGSLLSQLKSKKDSNDIASGSDTSRYGKFAKENPLFSILNPALQQNAQGQQEYRKGPVVGMCLTKDTGKVNRILNLPEVKATLPRDMKLLWSVKTIAKGSDVIELIAIKVNSRDGRAPLEGDAIVDARMDFGQVNRAPEISMSMNTEGARTWARLTGENIGHSIAIVLDDNVYSYPNVISEISGGRSSITGRFEISEAKDLANILKAGKLPAPARIIQESIVGPSLGAEAISASLLSFGIALVIILLFMGFYYSTAGWVANLVLIANLFFVMGVLSSLGAVLTLPGIAGIILTIGLAVDANILIFERVREELHRGSNIRVAIQDGYKHAMSSILDSNITLLILGIILFVFGTGPIQGFATTLIIGILTSLFAAVLLSRLVFEWMLDKHKKIAFSIKATDDVYKNISFNFVKRRKLYYIISTVIITLGVISYFQKGLNFGVDFTGGRTYMVRFDHTVSSEEVRNALTKPFGNAPEVKTVGANGNQLKITTAYLINDNSIDVDTRAEKTLEDGLKASLHNTTFEVVSSEKVGSNISDDIRSGAIWAILVSCALMFIYIFIRFKKWQYGLGAVVALFHDVLMVLSFYTILNGVLPFSLEIDQHFIAAILTVMGYTMTESVVVFDRIREYLSHNNKADIEGEEKITTINYALNSTLSRTINTSLTILFVLLAIFIFGGEVIRGFIFALLIGRVIGTYSSLCISTPIVIDFDKKTAK